MRYNDTTTMRAIGMLMARQARALAEKEDTPANDVIDLCPLLRAWKPGVHAAGDVVAYEGAPYRCAQEHDSTATPDWTPESTPALWSPYHATDAAHALPYRAPTGAQDAYLRDEWMRWTDGQAYRCTAVSTVWGPDVRPEDWEAEVT